MASVNKSKIQLDLYKHERQFCKEQNEQLELLKKELIILTERAGNYSSSDSKKIIRSDIANLKRFINEKQKKIDKAKNFMARIESKIYSLSQPSKNVLYYRYIEAMQYEAIAHKLNYSTQRIYQLHKSALEELAACIDKKDE